MKVSVIIVSYNVKHYLAQCLFSIFKSDLPSNEYEVFVIDNASNDNTPQHIQKIFSQDKYPNLKFITGKRNVGFGRANNECIRQANGKYILFLNPDTIIGETTLSQSINFAEKHSEMGGHGVMMLKDNGEFAFESRRGLPTPWVSFCKMSGLQSLFPKSKLFGKYYMRYLDQEEVCKIDIISGAYFFTSKSALSEVGLFDEDFFMYGEDIDLSYRMIKQGYTNYYLPSPILHYKGESTHKSTFRYVHVFYGAMLTFFKKHFRTYWLGVSIPIKIAIFLKAILALTVAEIKKLKKFLFPIKKYKKHNFIYIGKHQDIISELAKRWWLNMEYVEADSKSFNPSLLNNTNFICKDLYTHVVFDIEDFNNDFILDFFRKSEHKAYMGTYNPTENVLITATRVFSNESK